MPRRLIVDAGVLVSAERRQRNLAAVVAADDDVVIAAITLADLRTGIELADERHRAGREHYVASLLQVLPVEPYGATTAHAHARLLAHVHPSGSGRGAHDLIVAATAVATNRTVLTTDRKARFLDLPGVDCLIVS